MVNSSWCSDEGRQRRLTTSPFPLQTLPYTIPIGSKFSPSPEGVKSAVYIRYSFQPSGAHQQNSRYSATGLAISAKDRGRGKDQQFVGCPSMSGGKRTKGKQTGRGDAEPGKGKRAFFESLSPRKFFLVLSFHIVLFSALRQVWKRCVSFEIFLNTSWVQQHVVVRHGRRQALRVSMRLLSFPEREKAFRQSCPSSWTFR